MLVGELGCLHRNLDVRRKGLDVCPHSRHDGGCCKVCWIEAGRKICIEFVTVRRVAGSRGCDTEVVVVDVHAFENR